MRIILIISILLFPTFLQSTNKWKWKNTGRLYDERNQYIVTCRLVKEKRVEPFFGEDSVKCFYTCTDKDNIVITTHSDHVCEKQIQTPRGDQRDWRNRLKY